MAKRRTYRLRGKGLLRHGKGKRGPKPRTRPRTYAERKANPGPGSPVAVCEACYLRHCLCSWPRHQIVTGGVS